MIAATPTAGTTPSALTVLGRAAAGEWTRLTTLRSTWWSLLGAAALMLFMGVAAGADFAGDGEPVWVAAEFAIFPGQFAFLLVVVLAVTADYSTGAILSSLQWVPDRGVLLLARTAVPVAAMTVAAVTLSAVTDLVAWAIMGDAVVVASDVARSLGSIALVVAAGGLLSAGLAMVLRSTAGALTATFLLLLVLPVMLSSVGVSWLATVAELLPGYATVSLLEAMEMEGLSSGQIGGTLAAWLVAAGVASTWVLLRRDAT